VPSYLKLKRQEWDAHARHLSPWEREHTLDC
jgi:glutamate---methylamine ligase